MFNIEPILQFSRDNCVAICAFLVPANLIATISTIVLFFQHRPIQLSFSATVATFFALTLFLHIATWFIVGIITPVTFILAGLGTTCIVINLSLIIYQSSLNKYLLHWQQNRKISAQ